MIPGKWYQVPNTLPGTIPCTRYHIMYQVHDTIHGTRYHIRYQVPYTVPNVKHGTSYEVPSTWYHTRYQVPNTIPGTISGTGYIIPYTVPSTISGTSYMIPYTVAGTISGTLGVKHKERLDVHLKTRPSLNLRPERNMAPAYIPSECSPPTNQRRHFLRSPPPTPRKKEYVIPGVSQGFIISPPVPTPPPPSHTVRCGDHLPRTVYIARKSATRHRGSTTHRPTRRKYGDYPGRENNTRLESNMSSKRS